MRPGLRPPLGSPGLSRAPSRRVLPVPPTTPSGRSCQFHCDAPRSADAVLSNCLGCPWWRSGRRPSPAGRFAPWWCQCARRASRCRPPARILTHMPKPGVGPEAMTSPSDAAYIGVPTALAMSRPACRVPPPGSEARCQDASGRKKRTVGAEVVPPAVPAPERRPPRWPTPVDGSRHQSCSPLG